MTIATEINRLQIAKNNIKSAIEAKGVTVGSDLKLDAYPSKIAEITGGGSGGSGEWSEEYWLEVYDGYVRPADWLILPTLLDTDQKFVGLHAVWEDSNFLSLSATGAYTVDWGDGGVIENYNSGVQAYHVYDYNSIDINTLCSRGYKQVIVVVTPQSGNLTNINLNLKHNQSGLQRYASGWLDIRIAGSLSSLNISSNSPLVLHSNLEIAELRGNNTIETFDFLFNNCYKLQHLTTFNTSNGTSFNSMFQNCYSLQTIPLLDTALGDSFNYMFAGCNSLQTIPILNTSKGTNFGYMFYGCNSLQTIPLLDTVLGTNFSGMFYYCYMLQTIPSLNTSNGTNFSSMFRYCVSLQTIPLLNTSKGTNFGYMFQYCFSLQTIPPLNLFSNTGTALTSVFANCSSLIKGRTNNTYLAISYTGCKLSATAIVDIFKGLSGGITNISTDIDSTQTIITVNDATLLVEAGYAYIWNASTTNPTDDSTHEIVLINSIVGNQLTVTRAQLGTTARAHILGRKIGTYKPSRTITITNNWGAALLNSAERAIATARGWTITG